MNQEFKELLENIPNSYSDFVFYMTHKFTSDEDIQKITDFINNTDNVTTSKVTDFIDDEILHIPRIDK